jgi:hypothetical protein
VGDGRSSWPLVTPTSGGACSNMERSAADARRVDDPTLRTGQPEGKRNVLEGRLIWLALSAGGTHDLGHKQVGP